MVVSRATEPWAGLAPTTPGGAVFLPFAADTTRLGG